MKGVHKPMPLGKRIVWLFTRKGLPSLAAILVGAAIGWFVNGVAGLLLATVAGFLVLAAFKKLPIRLTPWQALVTDISPIIAKMCFMMVILLPVAKSLMLPTGQYPDTLTKYVSILIVLPKNIISGAPANSIFPGVPIIVVISVVLMVWGSMNLGRTKMWLMALLGLLLFTFSPSIASVFKGDPGLRLSMSSFSIGYYLAWFGLIWMMVAKLLPKILKTTPARQTGAAGALNMLPPIVVFGLLSQHGSTIDLGLHFPFLGSLDFESMHHGIAAGFSAAYAGIGAGAITEEAGYDGEESPEEFSGNEAPPEKEIPEPEPTVPAGPQPSTDPEDPTGTTIEKNKDGTMTKRMPDGWTATKYTDGTIYGEGPNGEKVTYYPDGTSKEYTPEGGLDVKHPNGDSELTTPDGATTSIVNNADGTMDITSGYGGTLHVSKEGYPEGTLTAHDGTRYTCAKDGSVSIATPDGTMTMDADGNMTGAMRTPEGDTITAKPDGTIEAKTAEGDIITIDKDGLKAKFTDGSFANMDSNGNITSAHLKDKEGTIDIATDDKGSTHIKDDQGNSVDINKDGSGQMKGSDGSSASQDANGNATVTNSEGTTWSAKNDGSGTITDKKGNKIELHKDGSLTVKESSGKSTHYTADEAGQMNGQPGGGQ